MKSIKNKLEIKKHKSGTLSIKFSMILDMKNSCRDKNVKTNRHVNSKTICILKNERILLYFTNNDKINRHRIYSVTNFTADLSK